MIEVKLGGCSSEIERELGSVERAGWIMVELGAGMMERDGDSSTVTSESADVDITATEVVKVVLPTIS